jgi:hypothetical protein
LRQNPNVELQRKEAGVPTTDRIRLRLLAVVAGSTVAGVVAVFGALATPAQSITSEQLADESSALLADARALTFEAELRVRYPPAPCPAGTPVAVECFARTGGGTIRGLGSVTESYAYSVESLPAGCNPEPVRVLPAAARLSVLGKGEIEIRVAGTGCLSRVPPNPLLAEETFTITGGSGRYAGASGGGTIAHVSYGPPGWSGRDKWTGTLVVPELSFDVTPPTLTGASNRTIRVPKRLKRIRVRYAVDARDDVDGQLPVTCEPRSGSWFTVGRTRVLCSATDTSGNESGATFVVTVKRKR